MSNISFVNIVDSYREKYTSVGMLGILSLATVLKRDTDHHVKVIDFQHEYILGNYQPKNEFDEEIESLYEFVMKDMPNLVSFYTMCNNYHLCIALARKIKERNPEIKVLFGGPQASLTATDTIKEIGWIDAVSLGEGERSIIKTVNALLYKGEKKDVPGLVYKMGDQYFNNGMPELIGNLDDLPFIDYSFLDMSKIKSVDIDAGRGCPFGCIFCSTKSFWERKFRLKSPNRIVKEILLLKETYGITIFSMTHDLFTANKKKVIEFCNILIRESIDIEWSCSSRVDTIDNETAILMAKSGCNNIFLGVETGSPEMQKKINKNLKVETVIPAIKILKANKIEYVLSFIYGFPDESLENVDETLSLIHDLFKHKLIDYKNVQLHELAFFPGTELIEKHSNQLVYRDSFNSTMMKEVKLPAYLTQIIKNNKLIFPHFFNYEREYQSELEYLDKYLPLVLLRTISKYRFSYNLILGFYNNSILDMFRDYKKYESEFLSTISFYSDEKIRFVIVESIHSVKRFIESNNFGNRDFIIKQIAQFEYDITDFLFLSKEDENILSYPIDVYKAVKNSSLEDIHNQVRIRFRRSSDKKIDVVRI